MPARKHVRSCDDCSFYNGQPGFLFVKMVCMAPEDSDRNPAHNGRHCPCFVPKQNSLNVAESLAKMTAWAERDARPSREAEKPERRDESVEDLELAAAEAQARAAKASAAAAEAEARLAEARLRAARRRD